MTYLRNVPDAQLSTVLQFINDNMKDDVDVQPLKEEILREMGERVAKQMVEDGRG